MSRRVTLKDGEKVSFSVDVEKGKPRAISVKFDRPADEVLTFSADNLRVNFTMKELPDGAGARGTSPPWGLRCSLALPSQRPSATAVELGCFAGERGTRLSDKCGEQIASDSDEGETWLVAFPRRQAWGISPFWLRIG